MEVCASAAPTANCALHDATQIPLHPSLMFLQSSHGVAKAPNPGMYISIFYQSSYSQYLEGKSTALSWYTMALTTSVLNRMAAPRDAMVACSPAGVSEANKYTSCQQQKATRRGASGGVRCE